MPLLVSQSVSHSVSELESELDESDLGICIGDFFLVFNHVSLVLVYGRVKTG